MIKCKPKISHDLLNAAVVASDSWTDLCKRLRNGRYSYGAVRTLKRYVAYYGLNTAHFAYAFNSRLALNRRDKYTPEQIFKSDSLVPTTVASRAYRKLYPPEKCSECGTGTIWNNKPLTLQIDHINGHGTDWRVSNVRYLCANCHYQTDTHGTKRGYSNKIKATPQELAESFDRLGSYLEVGKKFNVSDRTVKNIIRKLRRNEPIRACRSQQKNHSTSIF